MKVCTSEAFTIRAYMFLKMCAVMCELIQLLYSNECTHDQYPFNGRIGTGTGTTLV